MRGMDIFKVFRIEAAHRGQAVRQVARGIVRDHQNGDRNAQERSPPETGKPANAARAVAASADAASPRELARRGIRSGSRAMRAIAPSGTSARNNAAQNRP